MSKKRNEIEYDVIHTRRQTFDNMMLHILSYLSSLPELNYNKKKNNENFFGNNNTINCEFFPSITNNNIIKWEKHLFPFTLPLDLKNFLLIFNGFKIEWFVNIGQNNFNDNDDIDDDDDTLGMIEPRTVRIGLMRIFRLEDFERIPLDENSLIMDDLTFVPKHYNLSLSAAYIIDESPYYGKIILFFPFIDGTEYNQNSSHPEPQIWLIDLESVWIYLTPSFTYYLRLMIVHLGIIGWQSIYSLNELNPITKQWLNLFIPERLIYDIKNWNQLKIKYSLLKEINNSNIHENDYNNEVNNELISFKQKINKLLNNLNDNNNDLIQPYEYKKDKKIKKKKKK